MNANVMSSMSAVSISATWSAFFRAQTLSSAISAASFGARWRHDAPRGRPAPCWGHARPRKTASRILALSHGASSTHLLSYPARGLCLLGGRPARKSESIDGRGDAHARALSSPSVPARPLVDFFTGGDGQEEPDAPHRFACGVGFISELSI